ncbi:MAG: hypothetical protein JNK77_02970 [Saprospiraceae bacterium]|nr:hypothetical protein [Saprospiraceae bacterium]
MEERNKQTLKEALAQLPQYRPDEALWQRIEGQLAEAPLREALQKLPLRQPSEDVWQGIEKQLGRKGQVRSLQLARWVAAAAVLCGIGFAMHWLLGDTPARVTTAYAQEQAQWPVTLPPADAGDEEAFQEIPRMLMTSVVGSAREEIAGLQSNLDELNEAVNETQAMIKRYGADGPLLQQIVELERERTLVIKQMAALL